MFNDMRAARLHGVGDIRVGEEPAPPVADGSVLVRVTAVGICGSDLHWWDEGAIGDARLTHPLVLGHEAAGIVDQGPRRGERVAIDPAIPCQACRACLLGRPIPRLAIRAKVSNPAASLNKLTNTTITAKGLGIRRHPTKPPHNAMLYAAQSSHAPIRSPQ